MTERSSGSALILSLFVLAFLTALGVALLTLTQGEVKMGQGDLRAKRAFFLAEAALEDGRTTLLATNGKGSFDDDLDTAYGSDDTPGFDPDAIAPVFDTSGAVTGFTGYGDDVPLRGATAFGDADSAGWYAAFLTNDPVEQADVDDSDARVMISGVGVDAEGSMEVVRAIVELEYLVANPPSSITLLGPNPGFQGGNSSAKLYLGDDCSDPSISVPTVGVIGAAAETAAAAGVDKPATYVSAGSTGVDTVQDVDAMVDPQWKDCWYWIELAQRVKNRADVVGDASTPATSLGIPGAPKVVFIEDDYLLPSGVTKAGLLWVTGQLSLDGNASFQGAMFVVGQGLVARSTNGNGSLSGGVIVSSVSGPDGLMFTADDCAGPDGISGTGDDGLATAGYFNSGGGNHSILYCLADFDAAIPPAPYRITDFLQR